LVHSFEVSGEIHPVDAFDLDPQMIMEDIGVAAGYVIPAPGRPDSEWANQPPQRRLPDRHAATV